MALGAFVDNFGDLVDIETIVGFTEFFCIRCNTDEGCPSYIVEELPNYGDMVVMRQITDISYDPDTRVISYTPTISVITVEPWKISSI